jgi:non-heme chloroperoxidase
LSLEVPAHRPVRVTAPDGVAVSAQVFEPAPGAARGVDLLFLHGFSQSHRSWLRQLQGPLARRHRLVTYDLRGHGASDKPDDDASYQESPRWAGEVRAVIEQKGMVKPVVVAWSYAGRILLDYVGAYGDRGLSGIVMANATSKTDPQVMGPAAVFLRGMCDADPAVALDATRRLLAACVARPLPDDEFAFMLEFNQQVAPGIRAHLRRPAGHYGTVLRSIRVPVLVIHGRLDPINQVAMAEYTTSHIPGAQLLLYEDVAHMPFWEDPQRFDADVAGFLAQVETRRPAIHAS